MPYALNRNWSLETLIDYLIASWAAASAMEELKDVAAQMAALKTEGRQLRDARDDAREATIGASARVRVLDTVWDGRLVKISDRAYSLANKDADASPYVDMFGAITAKEAKEYGPVKATAYGKQVIAKGRELNDPELNALIEALVGANEKLEVAQSARSDAETAEQLHVIKRKKFIEKVENAVAVAEIAILTRFPKQKALVAAILSPSNITSDAAGSPAPSASATPAPPPMTAAPAPAAPAAAAEDKG